MTSKTRLLLILMPIIVAICFAQNKFFSTNNNGVTYLLRIIRVDMCQAPYREMFLTNVTITQQNMQQYISTVVSVPEDMYVKKMQVSIERCNYEGYGCENFQTWNLDNICVVAFMKGQIWSPTIENTSPKFSCPHVRKGIYRMNNATINLNKVLQLYPEAANYYWKGNASVINSKGNMISCTHAEGKAMIYRERKRPK